MLVHNNGACDVNKLVKDAEKQYPKKANKWEKHHVDPKYMGGAKNGKTVRIPAAYHQKITNAFRELHPHGGGKLLEPAREKIREKVYSQFPISSF